MTIRYRGSQIKSYSPIIDARADDSPRVLDGRNFKFDAKGPKAGFGNKILTPFPFSEPLGVQGLNIRNRVFVITQDTILTWRSQTPYTWEVIYNFPVVLQDPMYFPWFGLSMNEEVFLGHVSRGLYRSPIVEDSEELRFEFITSADIPGLPEQIRGGAKVRNRVILVTDNTVYWSATGDFTSLAPTPGGAGFTLLSDFVTGEYLGISPFNEGFIVWTTGGAVLAEYIDGDLVWRWSVFESQERPIGPWAMQQMSNGMSVFLSARGLKYTANGQIPQDWTPEFNEFFRGYVNQGLKKVNARDWRLAYNMETEEVYLSESADSQRFWRTFVLHPTIDKWGIFSELSYGLLPFTTSQFGYVDISGIPRYFTEGPVVEQMPLNSVGANRTYPRVQKTIWPPSTSAVSRVRAYNPDGIIIPGQGLDLFPEEVISAGWHTLSDFGLIPYYQGGMNSAIEIGYLRPAEMPESSDGNIEIHELIVSTPDSSPPESYTYQIEGYETLWDWNTEDWNSSPGLVFIDFTADLMLFSGSFDLNLINGPVYDGNDLTYPIPTWPGGIESEDWNSLDSPAEDWNSPTLNLPPYKTRVEILYSMDGRTEVVQTPELVRFDRTARTYVTLTNGSLHRVRFYAEAPLEYYHVTYLELTEQYGGQSV